MSKIAKVSRCANNAGIPVISLRKRSYRRALMISTVSIKMFQFDFHFNPIKKSRDCKNKYFSFNYRSSTFRNALIPNEAKTNACRQINCKVFIKLAQVRCSL